MPRRANVIKRETLPDAKYQNVTLAKIIKKIMLNGKKSIAEKILFDAMGIIQEKEQKDPVAILEQAVKNATPLLEVKARRVGGANYQVPIEVTPDRGLALAIRWLIKSSRARGGHSMAEKIAGELLDAFKGQGATVKKREDTHKMAEANRAFAHYKW